MFFLLMMRRPPRSTLFPYRTLSRSVSDWKNGKVYGIPKPGQKPVLVAEGFESAADLCLDRGGKDRPPTRIPRSEEHTSELQSHLNIVCRLLLEKQNSS